MLGILRHFITKYWLLLFFICISLFIIIYDISFSDISSQLSRLTIWQLGVLVTVVFVSMGMHILSRIYLLNVLDAKCTFRNVTYIYFSTLAANYSTPVKIGYPLAIYLLNKFDKVPLSKGTAMLLIELVFSTGVCGIIALFSIGTLTNNFLDIRYLYIIMLCAFGVVFLIIVTNYFSNYFVQNPICKQLNDLIFSLKNISFIQIFLYSIFVIILRIIDGFSLWLLAGFIAEPISIWQAIISSSAAFFIGSISMVPMGIGTRDISLIIYLQHYGVSDATALIIITIQRMLSTGLTFILGMIFGSVIGIKNMVDSDQLDKTP